MIIRPGYLRATNHHFPFPPHLVCLPQPPSKEGKSSTGIHCFASKPRQSQDVLPSLAASHRADKHGARPTPTDLAKSYHHSLENHTPPKNSTEQASVGIARWHTTTPGRETAASFSQRSGIREREAVCDIAPCSVGALPQLSLSPLNVLGFMESWTRALGASSPRGKTKCPSLESRDKEGTDADVTICVASSGIPVEKRWHSALDLMRDQPGTPGSESWLLLQVFGSVRKPPAVFSVVEGGWSFLQRRVRGPQTASGAASPASVSSGHQRRPTDCCRSPVTGLPAPGARNSRQDAGVPAGSETMGSPASHGRHTRGNRNISVSETDLVLDNHPM
ncbi:hypothetical protein B0J13DRAFT_519185 [Dactylonectria estremocensis]|uniref:Uncharacterized protein n=1 Tax=Dactylonectria estremocensis TaxID=1079267 RepID=A0A9P9FDM2_9HYPO|nr:hypothetical protein B0J13DRAFT_519185 [Dactylonectria estremocensis]